jgi:tetratricopeptide (TPR) repeat protein
MSTSSDEKARKSQKAGLLIELCRWEEALTELGPILAEDPGDYEALCQKALCHYHLGEYQAAYDTTKKAIENGPEFEWAYRIQSHVFSANGEINRALDAARICVEKAPYLFEVQETLFYALINYGLLGDARIPLQALLRLSPDSAPAYSAKGYYLFKILEFDDAEAAFLEALKIQPDDPNTLNNLGALYHEMHKSGRGKRYKKLALEMFERAVKAKPTFAPAQNNVGLVKQKHGISGVQKAGIIAIFVILLSGLPQSILHVGFTAHEPLSVAYKQEFSPYRGDDFLVVINSIFLFIVMIGIGVLVRYLTLENKARFREQYSSSALWKAFLCLNLGMITIYCIAMYKATTEINAFPGFAIRVFLVGAIISFAKLANIHHSESAKQTATFQDVGEDSDLDDTEVLDYPSK